MIFSVVIPGVGYIGRYPVIHERSVITSLINKE